MMLCSASLTADITYWLNNPASWPADIRSQIEASIQEAVQLYNQHGSFNKQLSIEYNPGVPTADGNINGNIRFGGSRNTRVAMHEIAHTLGVGTHWNWHVNGPYTTAQIRQFDGPGAWLSGDSTHFWPYGLNYDNEDGFINRIRHIRMVAALVCDMGMLGIAQEPAPQTAALGGTAVFQVQAANAQTYQWYKEGNSSPLTNSGKIAGATTPTLQIRNIDRTDEGRYYCRVTQSGSSPLNSRPARLTTERLIAQWTFNGSVNDALGTFHGTPVGSPSYSDGPFAQAIVLNGTSDYVVLPTEVADAAFTVTAWVRWDGGNPWQRIFDFGTSTSQYMFLTPRSGANTLRFAIKSGVKYQSDEQILETAVLPVGQWVHVAVTLDGNTATLYVDGEPVDVNANVINSPFDFSANRNYIGKSQFSADPLFKGRIDDFRIYSYPLSALEVRQVAFGTGLVPWGGQPHPVPGLIQAEHFDYGGQDVAYNDQTSTNLGGQFRTAESVDIFALSTAGFAVGDIQDGEWLKYTVTCTAAQTEVFARVASTQAGGQIHFLLDDQWIATLEVPNTGSLTTWQTISAPSLPLPDRENALLTVEFSGTGFQLDWFQFGNRMPYHGVPLEIPGRIEFEDYDIGGQFISFYDRTDTNGYRQYRPDEPVDIMRVNDGSTAYVVFAEAGEWLEYTTSVQPGFYTLIVRTSSPYTAPQMTLLLGEQTLATFSLPATGGFYNFEDTAVPNVYLPGGDEQILRVVLNTSTALLNYIDFVREYNSADLTQNGRVDMDDFAVLAAQWLSAPAVPSADIAPPDGDGIVDGLDLLIMIENWLCSE
jgi:hypothetical protein